MRRVKKVKGVKEVRGAREVKGVREVRGKRRDRWERCTHAREVSSIKVLQMLERFERC